MPARRRCGADYRSAVQVEELLCRRSRAALPHVCAHCSLHRRHRAIRGRSSYNGTLRPLVARAVCDLSACGLLALYAAEPPGNISLGYSGVDGCRCTTAAGLGQGLSDRILSSAAVI
jgi:hypothetical protein